MKVEYAPEVKARIGSWLQTAPRGTTSLVSSMLAVSERTLRSWKKLAREQSSIPKRGRPERSQSEKHDLKEQISAEWLRQGKPGWRPVHQALANTNVPVRLIQETIKENKLNDRVKARRARESQRVNVAIKKPGAILSQDSTQMPDKSSKEVFKDPASKKVWVRSNEAGSVRAKECLRYLRYLKARGRLPLVWMTDNGSAYTSKVVQKYLEQNQVIHLRSLPRVPQHNATGEIAVREFKQAFESTGNRLNQAVLTLNHRRKRRTLGWTTADQFYKIYFREITVKQRQEFYSACRGAIMNSTAKLLSRHEKRQAEREAIYETLERFNLAVRTRGGQRLTPEKPEDFM